MRVRIKQRANGDYWDIEYKKWFHPWWQPKDFYMSQFEAVKQAKNLQTPATIELIPIKKRSTTYIHYTTGE